MDKHILTNDKSTGDKNVHIATSAYYFTSSVVTVTYYFLNPDAIPITYMSSTSFSLETSASDFIH